MRDAILEVLSGYFDDELFLADENDDRLIGELADDLVAAVARVSAPPTEGPE